MKRSRGRIVVTIECRMTSSRLPGKVLMEAVEGKSMLEVMVERVRRITGLDAVVLATTVNAADDPIEELAGRLGIGCFRGSEEDVLARVLGAAERFNADIIVELTGDCPLIDPEIVTQVLNLYLGSDCDYASNCEPSTYPVGMDTQVFSRNLLRLADTKGKSREDREHVSWYFRKRPAEFRQLNLEAPAQLRRPEIEITLDEKEDYELIRTILGKLYRRHPFFTCADIVKLFEREPQLLKINAAVQRKYY